MLIRPRRSKASIASFIGIAIIGLYSVSAQVTIPASFAVPASAVNTNAPGFKIQTVQYEPSVFSLQINTVSGLQFIFTEEAMEGMLNGSLVDPITEKTPINVADLSQVGTDGYFTWPGVINFDIGGASSADGNFNAPNYPDANFPGIPGTGTDKGELFSCRMLTYLFLPKGVTTFEVNSDDGFLLTVGAGTSPLDGFAVRTGSFGGPRSASDSSFSVNVQQEGYYAVRLDFQQGTGAASCEFFTLLNGKKILVNDRNTAGALWAYQWQPVAPRPAHATFVSPAPNATGAYPGLISITLQDGITSVATDSIRLSVNGTVVTPALSKGNGTTTINYLPNPVFASGSRNSAVLIFTDSTATQFTTLASHRQLN